jgi:HEAT repeat protein
MPTTDTPAALVRVQTVDALLQTGAAREEDVVGVLAERLQDPQPDVRSEAMRTGRRLPPSQARAAVPALAELLFDPNLDDARGEVLDTLQRLGREGLPALPALAELLCDDGDWQSSRAAARILAGFGAEGVPPLLAALEGGDADLRVAVLQELGRVGPRCDAAVPVLRRALQNEDQAVRREAAAALEKLDPHATGEAKHP